MSRKIQALGASLFALSLAGTALAADMSAAAAVARGEAALQEARTASNSTSKEGPLVMAQQSRAKKELSKLIDQAKAGQAVDPGAIDALIRQVEQ